MTHTEEVTIGTSLSATTATTRGHTKCYALVYTGATKSCINETYFHTLMLPNLKHNFTNYSKVCIRKQSVTYGISNLFFYVMTKTIQI